MRAPDFKFPATGHQAWLVKRVSPVWNACVGFWYVRMQGYHPMLEWFVVIVSHLRNEPGAPKANKNQTSSSHEIVIAAVDPELYLFDELDPDDETKFKLQMPLEVVHQFNNLEDRQVLAIGAETVLTIVSDRIKPDREKFHDWLKLFNEWSV
jgi:hypothetical protein